MKQAACRRVVTDGRSQRRTQSPGVLASPTPSSNASEVVTHTLGVRFHALCMRARKDYLMAAATRIGRRVLIVVWCVIFIIDMAI